MVLPFPLSAMNISWHSKTCHYRSSCTFLFVYVAYKLWTYSSRENLHSCDVCPSTAFKPHTCERDQLVTDGHVKKIMGGGIKMDRTWIQRNDCKIQWKIYQFAHVNIDFMYTCDLLYQKKKDTLHYTYTLKI